MGEGEEGEEGEGGVVLGLVDVVQLLQEMGRRGGGGEGGVWRSFWESTIDMPQVLEERITPMCVCVCVCCDSSEFYILTPHLTIVTCVPISILIPTLLPANVYG
jgi:hypothetical protein